VSSDSRSATLPICLIGKHNQEEMIKERRMSEAPEPRDYLSMLRNQFWEYREHRFAGEDRYFEERPPGDPVVFCREYREYNVVTPNSISEEARQRVINLIPVAKRHTHFGSLQSSQALVQSVFGSLVAINELAWLSNVVTEDGTRAFLEDANNANCVLEKDITTLGEHKGHSTQVDFCIENPGYRVAVECKLAEADFGKCSRPTLKQSDLRFDRQYCDGSHTIQRGRSTMCSLTEVGIRYWDYTDQLFGWNPGAAHRPCPLNSTYQLVRNILAACVQDDGALDVERGHALILYDKRNPTMKDGGVGEGQWHEAKRALRSSGVLRRLSWQRLLAQAPNRPVITALKSELRAKYGFNYN
jgi:hypothetical protein